MMTFEERRHAAIVEVSLRRLCEAVENLVARIADLAASIDAYGNGKPTVEYAVVTPKENKVP